MRLNLFTAAVLFAFTPSVYATEMVNVTCKSESKTLSFTISLKDTENGLAEATLTGENGEDSTSLNLVRVKVLQPGMYDNDSLTLVVEGYLKSGSDTISFQVAGVFEKKRTMYIQNQFLLNRVPVGSCVLNLNKYHQFSVR